MPDRIPIWDSVLQSLFTLERWVGMIVITGWVGGGKGVIGVVRWAPPITGVSLTGPRHLKRVQQQHLASQVCPPPPYPLLDRTSLDVVSFRSPGVVSPSDPEPLAGSFSSTGQGFDGLALGLASDSHVLEETGH